MLIDSKGSSASADAVGNIFAFTGLAVSELHECAKRAVQRSFAKGETIFHQGSQPARFHVVLDGWVRILQTGSDGELSVIRFVGPGELFGSFALFNGGGYPADASATVNAVELSWSETDMRKLIDRYPTIAVNLLSIAADRLAELQERVRELSTQPAEQRIANALIRLAGPDDGQRERGPLQIGSPLTRKDVATLSGTTLYTASRVLSGWVSRGILRSAARRISIASPVELKRIAGGT